MGEIYYITGIQIGLLMLALEGKVNISEGFKILKDIEDNQFIRKKKDLARMLLK